MNFFSEFTKGIIKCNPVVVLGLGLCPALAVSTSVENALWMSAATSFVLIVSNVIISALKALIPDYVRIPVFMVIITALTTVAEILLRAYYPIIHSNLGIYLPLMVVNCIILGRAEEFSSKQSVVATTLDSAGYSAGFALILVSVAFFRELLGANRILGFTVINGFQPASVFVMAPGAFFIIGVIMWGVNSIKARRGV